MLTSKNDVRGFGAVVVHSVCSKRTMGVKVALVLLGATRFACVSGAFMGLK